MLIAGSHANGQREPGQAGNGAAISVSPVVPWNNLAGVGWGNILGKIGSNKSARPIYTFLFFCFYVSF